ncbi:MAG TPA: hypothetical protein DCL34_07630 [Erythrobacter sp.]|jgi:hypothetical protein|nr:hypothetical protein [Erythrobacter sp.]QPL38541.1 hypothetical protein IT881_10445 [Erythrobacter sp. A30-3]HAG36663.1 hypothetical protein [Erythrobacter sp.]|tara:strand:- start:347 stop:664 length:318 start_codon:yes stop_codon:yes gene_type:complete
MDKKFALMLAGGILLTVALTMAEGGPVDRMIDTKGQDAHRLAQIRSAQQQIGQSVDVPNENGAQWFAGSPPVTPTPIEVYRPETVHVEIPPDVIDPAVVAASPIR